jgi:hypothetical protein
VRNYMDAFVFEVIFANVAVGVIGILFLYGVSKYASEKLRPSQPTPRKPFTVIRGGKT